MSVRDIAVKYAHLLSASDYSRLLKDADYIDWLRVEWQNQVAEIERLKAALAESCEENRTVVLEEGPWSTDMCPLANRQQAEIERLLAERLAFATESEERQVEIERLNKRLDDANGYIRLLVTQIDELKRSAAHAIAALEGEK